MPDDRTAVEIAEQCVEAIEEVDGRYPDVVAAIAAIVQPLVQAQAGQPAAEPR